MLSTELLVRGQLLVALIVGIFGLLLLLSVVLQQVILPEARYLGARGRISKLNRLQKTVDAALSPAEAGKRGTSDIAVMNERISEVLGEVERSLHLDYVLMRSPFAIRRSALYSLTRGL